MADTKIYVGNLPYSVTENDLNEHFSQFGEITELKLITDQQTGRSKGFGFITYSSEDGCKTALAADGNELEGRKLNVNLAKSK